MQKNPLFRLIVISILLSTFAPACNNASKEAAPKEAVAAVVETPAKPDLAQIRTDIQALENKWAEALNTKNIDKLMSFYGDDIISMPNDAPMLTGKDAVRKQQELEFKNNAVNSYSFETIDVFSEGKQVLEFGKTIRKDATGKVVSTGKYTAFYEKRDGKYVCIREMFNNDQKSK